MNYKVFAAFFLTLLAIHASSQSPLKDDSVKQIVVAVLEKALEITGAALEKANSFVDSVEADEANITDKIVAFAVKEGKKLNSLIISVIDGLKSGATDDGKAVVDCIEAEEDKTDAAFEKAATEVGNCAAGEVVVVIKEVRTILSQLGDLQNDIQGQADTLSACSDSEMNCLVSFVGTIIETVKEIPDVVKGDIAQIIELVKTIIGDMKKCDILPGVKTSVQEIFNEAVVCIKS